MCMVLKGNVWKFGDNIDTDIIIPARYLAHTDPKILGEHCMEPLSPDFSKKVRPGDIIVAGANFGCGSSREHAPIAISAIGIPIVIARSFARIFYRNAFNKGLALIEADIYDMVEEGDEIEIDVFSGIIKTKEKTVKAKPIPPFMVELIEAGGLMNYLKKKLEERHENL
ncbi:MAG: 3-isopropylmalate dehydratase small subunit [Syntrophorhabdaceae bacterium]|nr:3-isopropylmalate dehydratase small subunit [Syntrophorhabdaceae bacterium]